MMRVKEKLENLALDQKRNKKIKLCSREGHPNNRILSYETYKGVNVAVHCYCLDCNDIYRRTLTPENFEESDDGSYRLR